MRRCEMVSEVWFGTGGGFIRRLHLLWSPGILALTRRVNFGSVVDHGSDGTSRACRLSA